MLRHGNGTLFVALRFDKALPNLEEDHEANPIHDRSFEPGGFLGHGLRGNTHTHGGSASANGGQAAPTKAPAAPTAVPAAPTQAPAAPTAAPTKPAAATAVPPTAVPVGRRAEPFASAPGSIPRALIRTTTRPAASIWPSWTWLSMVW